jgi:hypothetical protein
MVVYNIRDDDSGMSIRYPTRWGTGTDMSFTCGRDPYLTRSKVDMNVGIYPICG